MAPQNLLIIFALNTQKKEMDQWPAHIGRYAGPVLSLAAAIALPLTGSYVALLVRSKSVKNWYRSLKAEQPISLPTPTPKTHTAINPLLISLSWL